MRPKYTPVDPRTEEEVRLWQDRYTRYLEGSTSVNPGAEAYHLAENDFRRERHQRRQQAKKGIGENDGL